MYRLTLSFRGLCLHSLWCGRAGLENQVHISGSAVFLVVRAQVVREGHPLELLPVFFRVCLSMAGGLWQWGHHGCCRSLARFDMSTYDHHGHIHGWRRLQKTYLWSTSLVTVEEVLKCPCATCCFQEPRVSEDAQSATTLCLLVGRHPALCVAARDEGIAHRHFTDPQQRHPTVDFSLGSSSVVAMGTVLALFISTRFSGLRHEAPDCCQRGGDSLPFGGSSILRRQPIGCLLCASELTTICLQFYSCLRLFPSHSRRTLQPL